MIIIWNDPNKRVHGKLHKRDTYYFRFHYGKQRLVQYTHQYVDNPTEAQLSAREKFKAIRREVARQLHDPILRAKWERKFKDNPLKYKMLHTYVFAQLKKQSVEQIQENQPPFIHILEEKKRSIKDHKKIVNPSNSVRISSFIIYKHTILPIFLPKNIPIYAPRGKDIAFSYEKYII